MKRIFINDISWKYIASYFGNTTTLFRYYQDLVLEDCGPDFHGEVLELGGEKHYDTVRFFPHSSTFIVTNIDRDYDEYLDVTDIKKPDNSIDNYVMVSTLQHVNHPFRAMEEITRTLKPGGLLLVVNAFNHPICDTHDYWRFTEDAYNVLLNGNYRIIKYYKLGGKYASMINTFQRPRKSKSLRIIMNKIIGLMVAIAGKLLEREDMAPLGIGVLAQKIE